jgi:TolB-like protein
MLVVGGGLLGACAGQPPQPAPSPENLPALEAAGQQNPHDAGIITRLGIAYFEAKNFERARDVLLSALTITQQNYAAHIYLGLTYEELGRFDLARESYTTAAGQTKDARQRDEVEDRLVLLTRKELRQSARDAIAQEATLSAQPPTPNTVAVFPFRYLGANEDLRPLGRGLTHLMITDLAKLPRLTLLERERVQALVDELALTESGRVDAATGARSGRMLRAARVVQGSIQDVPGKTNLRLDASVVDAANASVIATGTGSDQLQQLFALEKLVLFRLLDQMGVAITPAERRALSERPTADLQAFLAFSRGLEAEDRGDYAGAEASFSAAVARDPNFRAAKVRQVASQRAAQSLQLAPSVLAGMGPGGAFGPSGPQQPGPVPGPVATTTPSGRGTILRTGVLYTIPTIGGTLTTRVGSSTGPVSRPPGVRPPLPEALGNDNPTQPPGLTGTIIIIITRP